MGGFVSDDRSMSIVDGTARPWYSLERRICIWGADLATDLDEGTVSLVEYTPGESIPSDNREAVGVGATECSEWIGPSQHAQDEFDRHR